MGILKKNMAGNASRRKFLGWSALFFTTMAAAGKFLPSFKSRKKKIKLLTHDGKLVEIEIDQLPVRRKLVSKSQLISWVHKNQEL